MPGDLSGGRWPMIYPFAKALGLAGNGTQANLCVRSNLEWFGLGNIVDGALAATEVGNVIPVPVEVGDVINKVSIIIGATKGKKVEAGFAALYQALNAREKAEEQPLLAQSKSAKLGEEVVAEEYLTFTLEKPVIVTPTIAPFGFLLVQIALEAETVPSAWTVATPKAIQKGYLKLFPNAPLALAGTAGAGLKTTAAATLGAITSKAVAPVVFLG
jgi:hypothetical protein